MSEFNDSLEEDIIEAGVIAEVDNTEREKQQYEFDRRRQELYDKYTSIVRSIGCKLVDYNTHNAIVTEEVERRAKEVAEWARKEKLLGGLPTQEILEGVYRRLKKGKSLVKALDGYCSVRTWNKWKENIEVVKAIEEQARAERSDKLLDETRDIADQKDRTRMGEVSRDKLMIESRLREVDRIDRLTANRMNKDVVKEGNFTPIQINVGYADKNGSIIKLEPSK